MLTVDHQPATVESQLATGRLTCPSCTAGTLRPWGHGRTRSIRGQDPRQLDTFTPRRARCATCLATHILLPVIYAARRADAAAVIGAAIEEHARTGIGHRPLAVRLERPEGTVRGWLRAFTGAAARIVEAFTARVHSAAADAVKLWPALTGVAVPDAVNLLAAHAAILAEPAPGTQTAGQDAVLVSVPWWAAALATAGPWLFGTHQPARDG